MRKHDKYQTDYVLHFMAEHNLKYYQKFNKKSTNPGMKKIMKLLNNYVKYGFDESHGKYIEENYDNLVSQVAGYYISLTGGKYDNLEKVKDSIKFLFGSNIEDLESFNRTDDDKYMYGSFDYNDDRYVTNLLDAINKTNIINRETVQYISTKISDKIVNDIIIREGNVKSLNSFDCQQNNMKTKGSHSIVYNMTETIGYGEKCIINKKMIKGIITCYNSNNGNNGHNVKVKYNPFHKANEFTEILINLLLCLTINGSENFAKIHKIYMAKLYNSFILYVIYDKLEYPLTTILKNKHMNQLAFDNIVNKLIQINYDMYHIVSLMHCDMKYCNLMIDTNDIANILAGNFTIYYIDFGLSFLNISNKRLNITGYYPSLCSSGLDILFFLIDCRKHHDSVKKYVPKWIDMFLDYCYLHMYIGYELDFNTIINLIDNNDNNILDLNETLEINKTMIDICHYTNFKQYYIKNIDDTRSIYDLILDYNDFGITISIDLWKLIATDVMNQYQIITNNTKSIDSIIDISDIKDNIKDEQYVKGKNKLSFKDHIKKLCNLFKFRK